jgi:hypothetical protein
MKRLITLLSMDAINCWGGFAEERVKADFADFNYRTVPLREEVKGLLTTFQNQVLYLQ